MSLKTIRAGSMADALAQVKRDIGPDAVILRTRTLKSGGVMGVGAKSVVEVTVTSAEDAPPIMRSRPPRRPPVRVEPKVIHESAAEPTTTGAPADAPMKLPLRRSPALDRLVTRVHPERHDASGSAALEEELSSIKKMVGELLHATRSSPIADPSLPIGAPRMGDALIGLYTRLIDAELSPALADEVLASARGELSGEEQGDHSIARATVVRLLAERLPVGDPGFRSPPTGARVAFIGPTGVGKTTTIAKLAATFKLRDHKRVGLVTADTFRIAAVDQLRTYANIIGVPLKVAMTPEEMGAAVASMADLDVVLIDTAGRSPSDAGRLDELGAFLSAAQADLVCLALSATSSERSVGRVLDRFAPFSPHAVALTKLDEAETLGPAINAVTSRERPIAILSTGQEVPEQFEWAEREAIARRLLGETPSTGDEP